MVNLCFQLSTDEFVCKSKEIFGSLVLLKSSLSLCELAAWRTELDDGSWYSDPVIDTYGKALLPVIREAVEAGRPPTDEELDRMVEAFRESLPDAADDFNVVGAEILTVSSREEINHARFQDALMRLGPVRSSRARDWEAEPVTVASA